MAKDWKQRVAEGISEMLTTDDYRARKKRQKAESELAKGLPKTAKKIKKAESKGMKPKVASSFVGTSNDTTGLYDPNKYGLDKDMVAKERAAQKARQLKAKQKKMKR